MKTTTENKELFTTGDWKVKGTSRSMQRFHVGTDETDIAAIFTSEPKAEANASLIAESKNMYYALQDFLKVINRSEAALYHYGDAIKNAEEILNRINKQ